MFHHKTSPSLHGVPPPRDAVVRRSVDGVYREAMPAEPGRDAERLQAVLLGSSKRPHASTMATGFMLDWIVRITEWYARLYSTCIAMIGIKR